MCWTCPPGLRVSHYWDVLFLPLFSLCYAMRVSEVRRVPRYLWRLPHHASSGTQRTPPPQGPQFPSFPGPRPPVIPPHHPCPCVHRRAGHWLPLPLSFRPTPEPNIVRGRKKATPTHPRPDFQVTLAHTRTLSHTTPHALCGTPCTLYSRLALAGGTLGPKNKVQRRRSGLRLLPCASPSGGVGRGGRGERERESSSMYI